MRKNIILCILFLIIFGLADGQEILFNTPGAGNPILPGYFADPTVKKFADIYYLYCTTDGIKSASGEPQVWISKDFVNWFNYEMEIDVPEGLTNVWAPDVFQYNDRYYYVMGNCEAGCNIYGYFSDTPCGPWTPLNEGFPIIKESTGLKNLPALDAQFLIDDDNKIYTWFGTWCHLFGGMGWAQCEINDMFKIVKSGAIPMDQIPQAFEAPYPVKRNGKYFLMYSSGNCELSSYSVHYSVGKSPIDHFKYGKYSPILETNKDGTIDGPGHNSVLEENGKYYIVYHRHDNPHSTGGLFRQVCADPMFFESDTVIQKIKPSHKGPGYIGPNQIPFNDLSFNADVSATSYYHLISKATRFSNGDIDHKYLPAYAVDNNNGTLWKSGSSQLPQSLIIDLGKIRSIRRILTQFEYPTFYYQYKIECSTDGLNWLLFADRTANRRSGSPMIDDGEMKARYVRITVTGVEKTGMFAAIWNIKIFDTLFDVPPYKNKETWDGPGEQSCGNMLVDLDIGDMKPNTFPVSFENRGTLMGEFLPTNPLKIQCIDGINALVFDGEGILKLNKDAPNSLAWNAPFTIAVWVNNPEIGTDECIMTWNSRRNMTQCSYAALMYGSGPYGAVAHGGGYVDMAYDEVPEPGKWHHIVLVFDGMKEILYVDGIAVNEQPICLFLTNSSILVGGCGYEKENYTGYLARAQLFDQAMKQNEIEKLMEETQPVKQKF